MPLRLFTRFVVCALLLNALSFTSLADDTRVATVADALETITERECRNHLKFLASDTLNGRDTPSTGLDTAAAYIASHFKAAGLAPAGEKGTWYQDVPLPTVAADPTSKLLVTRGDKTETFPWSGDFRLFDFSGVESATASVVFVGYGLSIREQALTYDDYEGVDVKGKFVLVLRGAPDGVPKALGGRAFAQMAFQQKAQVAHKHGAAGLLVVDPPAASRTWTFALVDGTVRKGQYTESNAGYTVTWQPSMGEFIARDAIKSATKDDAAAGSRGRAWNGSIWLNSGDQYVGQFLPDREGNYRVWRVTANRLVTTDQVKELTGPHYPDATGTVSEKTTLMSSRAIPIAAAHVSMRVAQAIFGDDGQALVAMEQGMDATTTPRTQAISEATVTFEGRVIRQTVRPRNVAGWLEGSDPELKKELIIIGAHYDHVGGDAKEQIFNGADDNGSGTTGLLEVAEAVALLEARPKRSFLFVAFAGEEKGLLGSRHEANNPLLAEHKRVAMLNMDMIGRNAGAPLNCFIGEVNGSQLSKLLDGVPDQHNVKTRTSVVTSLKGMLPQSLFLRSDQASYYRKNIPCVFFTTGEHPDYHRITDTVEKIEFEHLTRVARICAHLGLIVAEQGVPVVTEAPK